MITPWLVAAVLILVDGWYLLGGAAPASVVLPVGLPGAGMALSVDGLSAFAALPVGLVAVMAGRLKPTPLVAALVAAMLLTLFADDAFTLVLGFEAMALATFLIILAGAPDEQGRAAALLYLGVSTLGAVCLIAALALRMPQGEAIDARFTAMRAATPEGWRAGAVLVLALVGAGTTAGLAPLHGWLAPAHAAAPAPVSALMSGAMTKVALYVLIRIVFDLCGPVQPLWWGVPLIVLGVAGALVGAAQANLEGDIKSLLACSTIGNVGLIVAALGFALVARAADLPGLATLALGAALLHMLAHGLFKGLLFLMAGAVHSGAGTRVLNRLGGLIHQMPWTAGMALVGAGCLAGVPLLSGFAGQWMLLQSVLGTPRIGGISLQALSVLAALLLALAIALAAAAALRLVGVVFLGRPRSPRAAAAEEAPKSWRGSMLVLTGLSVLVGLLPGGVLMLAGPALRALLGADMAERTSWLGVAVQPEAPGYPPLGLALLLAAALGLVALVVRTRMAPGQRRAPAWDGGFGAPPAFMPFGDPLSQAGPAGFSQPLRRAVSAAELTDLVRPIGAARAAMSRVVDWLPVLTIRGNLVVVVGGLLLALLVVAVLEQP